MLLAKRGVVTATSLRYRPPAEKAAICRAVTEHVWPLIGRGAITPAPTTTVPMPQAADAHRLLESGENIGKIVLTL